ncbi:MAG: hypothetical protein WCJ07_15255, partial [Verrucomicrobiota bacterium]
MSHTISRPFLILTTVIIVGAALLSAQESPRPAAGSSLDARFKQHAIPNSPAIRTTTGPITGDEHDGIRSFKGVP